VAILRLPLLPYQRIIERWRGENERMRALRRAYFNPVEFEAGGQRHKIGLFSFNLMLLSAGSEQVRSQAGWPLFKDALGEMKQMCDETSATLVVVYIPTKERVYLPLLRGRFTPEALHDFVVTHQKEFKTASPEEFKTTSPDEYETTLYANMDETGRAVADCCRDLHVVCFDLTPAFRQAAQEGQLIYFAFDSHWNAAGNIIAANEIEQFLRGLTTTATSR
jgi:hypothetical protein